MNNYKLFVGRGKIARLPLAIYEELNQRLQDGEEGKPHQAHDAKGKETRINEIMGNE